MLVLLLMSHTVRSTAVAGKFRMEIVLGERLDEK